MQAYVLAKLKEDWSPEQIAGRIGIDHPGLKVSHEAIYQYIYAQETANRQELIASLKRPHGKRRHKGPYRRQKKTKILKSGLHGKTSGAGRDQETVWPLGYRQLSLPKE